MGNRGERVGLLSRKRECEECGGEQAENTHDGEETEGEPGGAQREGPSRPPDYLLAIGMSFDTLWPSDSISRLGAKPSFETCTYWVRQESISDLSKRSS